MEQSFTRLTPGQPAPEPQPLSQATKTSSSVGGTLKMLAAFIWRRLLFGGAVLLAIIYLTYLGMTVVQGTGYLAAAGQAAGQTLAYVTRLLQGDLGMSQPGVVAFRSTPVAELLPNIATHSLGLLGATFLLSIAIGVPLGAWAAIRRRTRRSILILIASVVGISTPSFFAALFLQIAAIQYTRTYGHSIVPVGGFGWDKHIILPMLVLAARPVAQITRITFVSLNEIFDKDYIRTAYSKGLRPGSVFFSHVIRNAAVPILTTIAVSLRFSLSSLPVVEIYFGWEGIGDVLLRSIFNLDSDLTIALFLILGLLLILINLLLEISYQFIDPRLRDKAATANLGERVGVLSLLKSLLGSLRHIQLGNPVVHWVRERFSQSDSQPSPFRDLINVDEAADLNATPAKSKSRWRAWRRGLWGNSPLLLGTIIVSGLIFLTLFGPRLAPHSPNTTQQIAKVDGVLKTPPFPPSEVHPWGTDNLGRDILSLILSGAQQTIILAFTVVAARTAIGFVLGSIAGWFHEGWLDRFIVGLTQALAVFPTLLLAALLIFIIGIQGGMKTFVIALALVGWGEIMQFVRGEVISIRPKPFIESAIAVGQRTSRLVLMHVLPNLAPALISVIALEVGAVLLILGELGFLGIFILGGASTDLFGMYSQVPEWGALLSGVRTWTRSYPWTGFYPTAAFFIAILGFNLLGEGIRRLVDEVGLVVKQIANRYTLLLAALLVVAFIWARGNTGELVFYRQQADTFSGQRAMAHIKVLTEPDLDGRALGSPRLMDTAEYIGEQFRNMGLQSAGDNMTYYQADTRTYQSIDAEPQFMVNDNGAAPLYLQDFSVYPSPTRNLGHAEGRVRLVAMGPQAPLDGLSFSQDILLLLSEETLPELANFTCQGVLVVAKDLSELKRRYTFSAQVPERGCGLDTPVLWISDRLASRLLQSTGQSVRTYTEQLAEFENAELIDIPTPLTVEFDILGSIHEDVPVVNVIGHLPGTSEELDNKLIIVAAQYDSPPMGPDGGYSGANDNASGVAVLLEIVRTLQAPGYEPFKTFLFVAYSGEGLPDVSAAPEVRTFLEARTGFATAYDIEGVIYLRGLGIGKESPLAIWSLEKTQLAKRVETAAHLAGIETESVKNTPTMNILGSYDTKTEDEEDVPRIGISRLGWERSARMSSDTLTFITVNELEETGRSVGLALMILGR